MMHAGQHNLEEIRAWVFDSDGVISHKGQCLPGVPELLGRLRENGVPFRVLTNSSFLDPEQKSHGYRDMGLEIPPDHILGTASVLRDYLAQNPLSSGTVWACYHAPIEDFLQTHGLTLGLDAPPEELGGVLLLDDDANWDAHRIAHLFNLLLKRPDLPVIVPNPDFLYPVGDEEFFITSGAPAFLLQTLLAQKDIHIHPVYFGKPYPFLYDRAMASLRPECPDLQPHQMAMVGDTPGIDILGANEAGWHSILVRTGNYRLGEKNPKARPDLAVENLLELVNLL